MTSTDYSELVAQLSLAEKVALLTGSEIFTMAGNEKIGLAPINLSDGPTGVRGLKFSGGRKVTLFPNATLLSASWSTDTAYEVGQLLAEEAKAQDIRVVLGPTINLHRSVLGGRLFEAYSEDPLLTGKLAAAYVQGLQQAGIGACLKHLVANESETDRNTVNSVVDEATLRELYLLPFEIAITEANPWSLMAAYNDVNGQAATEQEHVNNEVVKGEWGYDGLIMSDWFATKTTAPAANGGLDLVMPGPDGPWGEKLVAAVQAGDVAESVIDDHVVRVLRLADRVGGLGTVRKFPTDLPGPDSDVRREQLVRLAASGMTVLTNNGVLPLAAPESEQTVALIGRHGIETIGMGGGSAQVNPPHLISIAEGLGQVLGGRLSVTDGPEVRTRPAPATDKVLRHPESGEPGVTIEVHAADGSLLEARSAETAQSMVGFDDAYPLPAASVTLRARTTLRGPVEIGGVGAGNWTVTVGGRTETLSLESAGGIGAVMLAPPSSVQTVEITNEDLVEATAQLPTNADEDNPLAGVGIFSLVVRPVARPTEDILADARTAAAAADVAVVVVGLSEEQETEAADKSTIALPGDQDLLVSTVAEAARKTVVVVNAATPVLTPWAEQVDAILWAGLPSQEAWEVVPTDGALSYDEGTAIGYRGHFAGTAPAPAFWMGHGLGYSTWDYRDAAVVAGADSPTVRITVANTGSRDSSEVVQVYFQPAETDQPVRLVGWATINVAKGESAEVEVATDARLWRRWDDSTNGWGTPLSGGELLIARGLGDIRVRLSL